MLRVLLSKDLRRAWRNPLPWLLNLAVPLAMTALIGLVFGGKSDNGALGRIHFAIVDEDQSVLSGFLRGAVDQREGGKYLDPVFMDREAAFRELNESKVSAALIIPTNFMRNYLTGRKPVALELVKNPAESIHPAVLEELLGAAVTALNGVARNFQSEFPDWQGVFEGKEDYRKVSFLIERAGDKLKTARAFVNPPLVSYEKEREGAAAAADPAEVKNAGAKSAKSAQSKSGDNGVFAYLLVGLSGMFLLFLGSIGMADLHRELRMRTFERYQTLRDSLAPFIAGKAMFAVVMLLLCAAILLGGGGIIFRVHWERPIPFVALTFGYACFTAGFFALMVALVPDERRAGALNNIAGLALGIVGGCAFPAENLPAFLRDHVTVLMPSYWFVSTARHLQYGSGSYEWGHVTLKLVAAGLVLMAVAALLFRRRFKKGLRA